MFGRAECVMSAVWRVFWSFAVRIGGACDGEGCGTACFGGIVGKCVCVYVVGGVGLQWLHCLLFVVEIRE